ncbi:MAG: radical SAM protein [Candidatus Nealsonbacteria bacterium]|nr:MAG: radical SAM protein [Candidatus Nealsonbacteria bacterium]
MMHINLTYACNRNCNYCFAKGFLEKWPREISLQGLESVFRWATKQKIKRVSFGGGEPTLFSKINSALELAEKYGLKIVISTNGTTDIKRINIDSPAIDSFLVTLNPPSEYSSQELKTLYSNLEAMRRVKRVILRFNIISLDVSYSYLIDTCERLNIRRVDFALVLPSALNQNEYIKKEKLKDFTQYILKLAKSLVEHDIRGCFAQPFPRCLFSEKERAFLMKNSGFHSICWTGEGCVVTPDLTILPCLLLAVEGPSLKKFKNQKEITNYYKDVVNRLKWEIDFFPQCKDCVFKKNKQCQGGCLIYKFLQNNESVPS